MTLRASLVAVAASVASTALHAAPPDPAFTIGGHVLAPDGTRYPGASVTGAPLEDGGRPTHHVERWRNTTTGPDGRFALEFDTQPARLRVEIDADGFAPIVIEGIETVAVEHELGPLRLTGELSLDGVVRDEDGAPLAGVIVFADDRVAPAGPPGSRLRDSFYRVAVTDADGRYSVPGRFGHRPKLAVGPVDLGFAADGHALVVRRGVDLADPRRRRQDVTLPKAAPVRGRVVHAEDDRPVGSAAVRLIDARSHGPVFSIGIRTDAEGRFTLPPVPADRDDYAIEIEHDAFTARRVRFDAWPEDDVFRLVFGHQLRLTATSSDGDDGAPIIESVRVEAYTQVDGGGWRREVLDSARVRPEPGVRVWIDAPHADRVRLVARSTDGRRSVSVEIDPEVSRELEVAFAPRRAVAGVVDDGAEGVRVDLARATGRGERFVVVRTAAGDAEGRFRFDDVEEGAYLVRAWADGRASPMTPIAVEGADIPDLSLATAPAPTIVGRITVAGEAPAVPLAVDAWRYEKRGRDGAWFVVRSTVTAGDGTYALGPLTPGPIVVAPRRPSDALAGSLIRPADDARRRLEDLRDAPGLVRAPAAGVTRLDLEAAFPVRSTLLGRITVNDAPLDGAQVGLTFADGAAPLSGPTDRAGRFRLRVDGGGPATLSVRRGSLRYDRPLSLSAGEDLDLALPLVAGPVTGRIDAATPPARPPQVVLERPGAGGAGWDERARSLATGDGLYSFERVVTGRYRVRLEDGTHALAAVATDPFDVANREGAVVPPIIAPPGATLTVVMEDAEGGRLPFATLELSAARGAPPFPRPVSGWFVGAEVTLRGLRPGPALIRVVPHGPWQPSDVVTVDLGEGGGTTRVVVPIVRHE